MEKKGFRTLALGVLGLALPVSIVAATINVPADQATIAGAIAAATAGDTIQIAAGTYTEAGLAVNKALTINGAGAGLTIVQAASSRGAASDRVFNITAVTTLQGMTIRYGQSTANGAGIFFSGSTLTINNCEISDNDHITTQSGGGGGIAVDSGNLSISNSLIADNSSRWQAGGLRFYGNVLLMINCTVVGNVANRGAKCGGGVFFWSTVDASVSSIYNSTITGNSAPNTVAEPDAGGGRGGGLYVVGTTGRTLNLYSTIIAGNSAAMSNWDDFAYHQGTVGNANCLVGKYDSDYSAIIVAGLPNANGSYVGTNLAPVSSGLNSLADNGGDTDTCSLQPSSLAIGKGSNPLSLTTDQRGSNFLRVFGGAADIGAFELQTKNWDFNGDAKSDVAADDSATKYGYLYLMNGSTPSASDDIYRNTNPDWSVSGIADFNGDCRADLIWESASTGKSIIYLMDGFSILSVGTIYNGGTGWKLDKLGDFNGDGKMDILWKHPASGQGAIYLMDGTTVSSSASVSRGMDWVAKSTGDFNGDGKADILWEIASSLAKGQLYLMDGTSVSSQGQIYARNNTWIPEIFADFNGDGRCDILWQNSVEKSGYMYLMNGLSIESQGYVYTTPPAAEGWAIIESGDFNADGKSDLLWQNSVTGVGSIWLMNGLEWTSSGMPYTVKNTDWQVLRLLDFNGDGKADILWQNSSTLKALDYIVNGTAIQAIGTVFGSGNRTILDPALNN